MGGQQRLDTHRQPEGSIWRRSSSVNATYVPALTEFLGKLLDDSEFSRQRRSARRSAKGTSLPRKAIESSGLPLTATGNLSRAAVAEMRGLIEWPNYDQPNAFRLNKVINEPDFLSLHVGRILAQAASLVRAQQGKLAARLPLPRRRSQKNPPWPVKERLNRLNGRINLKVTSLGKSMLSDKRQGSLPATLFHVLAHGSRLFWPRSARLTAAG